MKKRVICLLLLLLLLTSCGRAVKVRGSGEFLFYFYPKDEFSLHTQQADGTFETLEDLMRAYLAAEPEAGALSPFPEGWVLESAAMEGNTAVLRFAGRGAEQMPLERSLTNACIAKTLFQREEIYRVTVYRPGESEPTTLNENDVILKDNGMLPQEEEVVLYFPDDAKRFLLRETRTVAAMDAADKPAFILRQLLLGHPLSCIPEGTELLGISVEGGICTVNLSSAFELNMERSFAAERMAVYSIVDSLTELPEIQAVDIWVAGAPLESLHYLTFAQSVTRDETLLRRGISAADTEATLYMTYGDGTKLVEVPVVLSERSEETLVSALLTKQGACGVESCIPAGTKLLTLRMENGVCAVDLTAELLDGCETAQEETMAVRSIVATLSQLPEVRSVEILVEGIAPNYRDDALLLCQKPETQWFAQ